MGVFRFEVWVGWWVVLLFGWLIILASNYSRLTQVIFRHPTTRVVCRAFFDVRLLLVSYAGSWIFVF